MKNKKRYADVLLNEVLNKDEEELTTLQLNLKITKKEKENLEAFVKILKENGKRVSIRGLCYNVLKDAGLFDEFKDNKD